MAKPHHGTYTVRVQGEPPTAAFALWIDLTREHVAVLQPMGDEDISIWEYLRHVAIDAMEAKFPEIGKINRHTGPHHE